MRFLFALVMFLPLAASAQKTDTNKRETRLKDFYFGVNGGYGTGNLYTAGLGVNLDFRKISMKLNGSQSVLRSQTPAFYVITNRGLGWYYYNYGITTGISFPETFSNPVLNRLTQQVSGSLTWEPSKKLKIDLSGSYKVTDDSIGFAVHRQTFTGNDFRTSNSIHTGDLQTERKSATLELRYPARGDNPFLKFSSSYVDEKRDFTLLNSYSDRTIGHQWGYIADAANRDISTDMSWVNSANFDKLWLPWMRFDNGDVRFKRKPIRLKLAHTYRMKSGIAHLSTRTDIVPESGPIVPGSERIFFIDYFRPSNAFSATLSMWDLVKAKNPEIEIDFMFIANYSEQPWSQNATRIDVNGANPEDALHVNSVLTTKLFTPVLSYWYKQKIGINLRGESAEITVRDAAGTTIGKRNFMLLPQIQFHFLKIHVQYEMDMLSPGAVNLLPNPDWRNPAYIESGNSELEFGTKHKLTLERMFYNTITSRRDSTVESVRRISTYGTFIYNKNHIGWIIQPDSSGILYARPGNLPYMLTSDLGIYFSRQFTPSFTLTGSLGHNWLSYDYVLNDNTRTMKAQTVRAHAACRYESNKVMTTGVQSGYTHVFTDYSGEKQFTRSFQTFDASFWFDVKLFDQLRFYMTCNWVHYVGPLEMGDKTIIYCNSNLEWSKLEGRFTARVVLNDLFNQNIYFARTDAHGLVQQVNGVGQGRYAMLNISWGFSKKTRSDN